MLVDNGASSYRRFLEGDDSGIVEIVTEYKDGLTLFLNGYVGNLDVAEELMEDTFFKLMVKKPVFFSRYSFKTWLYTIGRNLALDYLRKHARQPGIPVEDCERLLLEEETLEKRYIREEHRLLLHQTLGRLKAEYREVLTLTYFEGLTNPQAGRVMGKNKSQIEMLLYRAKQSLKKELEKEGFTYEDL